MYVHCLQLPIVTVRITLLTTGADTNKFDFFNRINPHVTACIAVRTSLRKGQHEYAPEKCNHDCYQDYNKFGNVNNYDYNYMNAFTTNVIEHGSHFFPKILYMTTVTEKCVPLLLSLLGCTWVNWRL